MASIVTCLYLLSASAVQAEGELEACTAPLNLSASSGFASADPLLLADETGSVHLFWAERTTGRSDSTANVPDTLMYAVWDGESWSAPIDIFISPIEVANQKIAGPRGVIDNRGTIHLIWMGPDRRFFYSRARADEAGTATAWLPPQLLADDQSGVQYGADIAVAASGTLHVAYVRYLSAGAEQVPTSYSGPAVITYVRSEDGGDTWSSLKNLHTVRAAGRGASNLRLRLSDSDPLYATWTEWDESGNGQAVYFLRSPDGGDTWLDPVLLDRRDAGDYERDWTNVAVLDERSLVAFWEGGFRAYPQAQYSQDGGATWSEPIDTFPWLIADNGYAEMVRDGSNRLHIFLSRRIREGFEYKCFSFAGCTLQESSNTIWHSIWQGGTTWSEPVPAGGFHDSNFTAVAISGGNRVTLAWFNYTELEVMSRHCTIRDAQRVAARPYPTPSPRPTPSPDATSSGAAPLPTPAAPSPLVSEGVPAVATGGLASSRLLPSMLPTLLLILVVAVGTRLRRSH